MRHLLFTALLIIFCYACCLISCKDFKKSTGGNKMLVKKIAFPKDLLVLRNDTLSNCDSILDSSVGVPKIISIVDANCVKCIVNHMNALDSVFQEIVSNRNAKMYFILNVNDGDSAYFMRNLSSYINTKFPVLWDNNYNFERCNNLFTPDRNLRTFLTNDQDQIIQYGNPILDPGVIDLYKDKLLEAHHN